MDVKSPPKIDMEAGTWTYHGVEDILDWKIIKTFGAAQHNIKVVILSFLVECTEDYSMSNFFDISFNQLSISVWSLRYGETMIQKWGHYHDGLTKLFSIDLEQKWKMPIYKLRILASHCATMFYGKQMVLTAIKNYETGSNEETPMHIEKVLGKDYEINKAKYTLVNSGTWHTYVRRDLDHTRRDLGHTEFYLVYQPKPPMMWAQYKAALVQRGLPQSYADRISQAQRDKLVNFGWVLTPTFFFTNEWRLEWREGGNEYTRIIGILNLKLEPIELSLPARKKRRGGLQQIEPTAQDKALAEIAPSYYLKIADCQNSLYLAKKSVKCPKFLTRKDTPVVKWGSQSMLWTGKAKFHRTWLYEAKQHCCGNIQYIPEGKMRQTRYGNNIKLIYANNKVMPARQPTSLKTIFTAGI
jgi:hypothetical protein